MIDTLKQIWQEAKAAIDAAETPEALGEVEIAYLGRKQGKLTLLLREIKNVAPEERKEFGQMGNEARTEIETLLETKRTALTEKEEEQVFFDYTLPAKKQKKGKIHPISAYIRELEDVFGRLGFAVATGPEVDDEEHNFNALNIPADHPAREMQDTFWVKNIPGHVLRTQTSNVQIHYMENNKPPYRVIAPGKVFRKDSDATHSPMFHQVEGLLVDKNVSLAQLKFVLLSALRQLISEDIELRFRTSYFPFTEPSLEVDALLNVNGEKKWLEIGGAGMVHPNVLRNVGVDPKEWNGFAFGFGIERQIMIRHGISDLRQFFENDLRFLEQF